MPTDLDSDSSREDTLMDDDVVDDDVVDDDVVDDDASSSSSSSSSHDFDRIMRLDIGHGLLRAQTCPNISTSCCVQVMVRPCLQTAVDAIGELLDLLHPAAFKIGITGCPAFRFNNARIGYRKDGFTHMIVLHAGLSEHGQELERALISAFAGRTGIHNTLPGGENPPPPPCFTYCVAACAAGPMLYTNRRQNAGNQF